MEITATASIYLQGVGITRLGGSEDPETVAGPIGCLQVLTSNRLMEINTSFAMTAVLLIFFHQGFS